MSKTKKESGSLSKKEEPLHTSDATKKKTFIDSRFLRPSVKKTKLTIDPRFSSVLDPSFHETDKKKKLAAKKSSLSSLNVDKFGRPLKKNKGKQQAQEMRKFYRLDEKDVEEQASDNQSNASDEDSEHLVSFDEKTFMDKALSEHPLANEDKVPQGDATFRFALVNLDWDQLKAVDIFMLLYGFLPIGGRLLSVTIYKSEFGKERMSREILEGPTIQYFKEKQRQKDITEEPCDDSNADEADFDSVALRRYQLDRLRYFYAIAVCDTSATAMHLYSECDGREFESSACFLDLRYIPDGVEFDQGDIVDECRGPVTPREYIPKPDMVTDALQRTRVKLTWDQDDPDRRKRLIEVLDTTTKKKKSSKNDKKEGLSEEETDSMDENLALYLASASSEDEHGNPQTMSKRELLLNRPFDDPFGKKQRENDLVDIEFKPAIDLDEHKKNNRDNDIHMEATFDNLDDQDEEADEFFQSKRRVDLEESDIDDTDAFNAKKTPFELYLERRKAKRRAKKLAKEQVRQEAIEAQKSALKGYKKKRNSDGDGLISEEARKDAARLALFTNEDAESSDDERRHQKKKKTLFKESEEKGALIENPSLLTDSRFTKQLLHDPSYAINPTDPAYKQTPGMKALLHTRAAIKKNRSQ